MVEKFRQLGISEPTLKEIKKLGFKEPSEIQEKSIPLVLEGKDVIAGASTGSGKTLAFGTGLIHNSKPDCGMQGLILTPTRELAEQITRELKKFVSNKKLNIISIYGGMSINRQINELESAEIVIATPGRLLDHLSRKTIDLQYVKTLVLDEADRMLDMGFKEDVEKIINQCPEKRQTLLYSATISSDIVMIAEKYMINPVEVSAEIYVDSSKLSQIYYNINDDLKFSLLKHLLETEKSELAMVFCNTRRNVDFVVNNLKAIRINALPIHGGFSQKKRNKIMKIFHSNRVPVLVCTDVAARGLDIKNVTHIYNYDIPKEAKEYIHRIGRTARAGEKGKVINIITSRDYDNFSNVLKHYSDFKIKLEETSYIKRVELKWMAHSRYDGRRNSRFGNNRGRRDDQRSYGGRGNRSYERKPSSKGKSRNYGGREDRRKDSSRSYGNRQLVSRGRERERSFSSGQSSESKRGYERRELKRRNNSGRNVKNRRSGGRRDNQRDKRRY